MVYLRRPDSGLGHDVKALVAVEDVVKVYQDPKRGDVRAVDGVSWQAEPGQVFGLLGVNGAGKTTLMRVLATLIQPTSGKASVLGHDTREQSQKVRESIGFLSSSAGLYARLTGRECLAYFGGLYGLRGTALEQATERVVELMNLHEFVDKPCDRLSTGQKQRVSIGRAILHDPPVLFLDEPTAGLDVVAAQAVMEFVELTKSQGKTIIYSTHIMSEAERLCDTICIIHGGKKVWHGPLTEALATTGQERLEKAFLRLIGYQAGGEA